MNTSWIPIIQYRFDDRFNAQAVYDQLFKVALTYKFRGVGSIAVPVNNLTLTQAIFDLKSTDKLLLGNKSTNGQKLKELFITTIFLKYLETKRYKGDNFFLVIPETETSCDTAIIVTSSESRAIFNKKLKLPKDHDAHLFQIKEYFDFKRSKEEGIMTIQNLDKDKISKLVGGGKYTENVIVFMREFFTYHSEDMKYFFEENQNCLLISIPQDIMVDGKKIDIDPDKHHFIITFSDQSFSLVSFNRPSFLRERADLLY